MGYGRDLTVRGLIQVKGEMFIDGLICGDAHSTRFAAEREASIDAPLVAGDVLISGISGSMQDTGLGQQSGLRERCARQGGRAAQVTLR